VNPPDRDLGALMESDLVLPPRASNCLILVINSPEIGRRPEILQSRKKASVPAEGRRTAAPNPAG